VGQRSKINQKTPTPSTRWDKENNSTETAKSYDLIVSWLEEPGNWAIYKGEDGTGTTKAILHGQVVGISYPKRNK
jgi:hypothetical protein